jgi:hypothetical protein
MKKKFTISLFFMFSMLFSQEKSADYPFVESDSLFREDQFYFGITYNRLLNKPKDFDQKGLSTGINIGFLRDMPFNKKRTFAVAIGIGLTYNKYHQNMLISNQNSLLTYEIIQNQSYDRNKFEQVLLDLPFEFRWRNATPQSRPFFRIHAGFRLSYLIFNKSKFVGENNTVAVINNSDFNKIQYGPSFSIGYNTWNFHAFYGLNPIFKNTLINDEKINLNNLNFGLMFYIL